MTAYKISPKIQIALAFIPFLWLLTAILASFYNIFKQSNRMKVLGYCLICVLAFVALMLIVLPAFYACSLLSSTGMIVGNIIVAYIACAAMGLIAVFIESRMIKKLAAKNKMNALR